MWIFMDNSFVSITDSGTGPGDGLLEICSPLRSGIEALFPGVQIREDQAAEYACRARVGRNAAAERVGEMIRKISYQDLLDSVSDSRRSIYYGDVFNTMKNYGRGQRG